MKPPLYTPTAKRLAPTLLAVSIAVFSLPINASLITSGDVFPTTLGLGDTTIASAAKVNTGSINIDSGTTLTITTNPFMNIGKDAGTVGVVTVTDNGSKLRLEGATANDGAFLNVGREGTGTLNILNGGRVEIDALGASATRPTGPTDRFPAGFQAGRDGTGTGVINISGAGSELSVTSDFAFGRIGRDGDGTMNITQGGTLTFSGKNSDLNVSSDYHATTSQGTLNVNTGGKIVGPVYLDVGNSPGGHGIVNLDGPTSSITLSGACTLDCPTGYSYPGQGAFLTVGSNQGTGEVYISNGAKMTIDASAAGFANQYAGFSTGGSSIHGPQGNGKIVVDGVGSELRVIGDESIFITGRLANGNGELWVRNGGQVIMQNDDGLSRGFVGDRPGATGLIVVDGAGSRLDVGSELNIGVDQGYNAAGNGNVLIIGGEVLADTITIDNGGSISGIGTLKGSTGAGQTRVIVNNNGFISAGLSPGVLNIEGDLVLDGGSLILEADSLTSMDRINVMGDLIFNTGFLDIVLGFAPQPTDILDFFNVTGTVQISDSFGGVMARSSDGTNVPVGTPVTVAVGQDIFSTRVASSVPLPSTLLLLGLGLGLAGLTFRRVA